MRLTAALALAAASLSATAPAAQTLERIAETGVIRLGVRADARPLSWMRDGEPMGFTVDLCLGVMDYIEKMHDISPISAAFVTVTAEDRFDRLEAGEVDLLCEATSLTLTRRARMDFSIPVYIDGASAMMRADHETDFMGFAGQRIGVRRGTSTAEGLQNTLAELSMEAEIEFVDDHAMGLDGVLEGRLAAYFADQSILLGLMLGSDRRDELQMYADVMSIEPQAIALPKGDNAFRLTVDTALSRLFRSGAVERMFAYNFAPVGMGQAMQALVTIAPIPE